VAEALTEAEHTVVPLAVGPDGCWLGADVGGAALSGSLDELPQTGTAVLESLDALSGAPIDVLFPLVHGTWGEDGSLQGLCEMLDVPFVGAGVMTSAVAMDKHLTKVVLAGSGIPVVEWDTIRREDFEADARSCLGGSAPLGMPLFVKPSVGGSSVGVVKVLQRDDLEGAVQQALQFDDAVLVERAIEGRELECSVLGYRELEASRIGEIVPGAEFYDYADKYLNDTAGLHIPAELDGEIETRMRGMAVEAFAAIGGWGMARVDFLLEPGGAMYINEINTLPGFTSISMYPKLWEATGISMPELVDRLVQIAIDRHTDRGRLDQGIRDWLTRLGG